MKIIVGLGNPGEKYMQTRHNIGFQCVSYLAKRHTLDFSKQRSSARIAEGHVHGERVALVKPQTYMNRSGLAVAALCNWYKIDCSSELLIVYDDMDISFGKIRIRQRGSPGTHNGMRSLVEQLGSQEFARIRVGIGSPAEGWDASAHVLGRFRTEEEQDLPAVYEAVADAIEIIVKEGITTAMNRYN